MMKRELEDQVKELAGRFRKAVADRDEATKRREENRDKFRKALPAWKVMRYLQIENKMDAVVELDMAAEIPLVK